MRDFLKLFFGLAIVVSIIVFCALLFESYLTEEVIKIKVTKKETVTSEDGAITYLIHTENEIFENSNNYFHKKENAESLNKKIKRKNTYKIKVVGFNLGFKIPFFTEYRNITEIVEEDKVKGILKY
ncbi:hypothetical protein ACFLS9_04595 [Bacteroidota bacterium]